MKRPDEVWGIRNEKDGDEWIGSLIADSEEMIAKVIGDDGGYTNQKPVLLHSQAVHRQMLEALRYADRLFHSKEIKAAITAGEALL